MAASPTALQQLALVVVVVVSAVATSAGATQFRVGGKSGWSVPGAGSEPYNTWAGRLRFQIGDQLLFVYPKETDSVVQVADAAAYNACNTTSYVARFDDGSTVFTFNRSGPFFFVSGNDASCRANQKLIVVVLADRSGTRTPPGSAAPAPVPATSSPPPSSGAAPVLAPTATPASPPAAPVPAPTVTPTSPPSPPASAPAPAPTTATSSSPPAPAAQTPSPSTTPTPGGGEAQTPSPSTTPTPGSGSSPPPAASANTPTQPSASAPVVGGFVGSLGAIIGYAMLAA